MNSEGHAAESPQGLAGAPRSEGYNNKDEFFERCDVPSLPSWMTPMMGEGRQLRHSGVGLSDLFLQREPANRLRKFKQRWNDPTENFCFVCSQRLGHASSINQVQRKRGS